MKLLFTSSISAAHGWDTSRGPVPEAILTDPHVAAGIGYGASKFVAESVGIMFQLLHILLTDFVG